MYGEGTKRERAKARAKGKERVGRGMRRATNRPTKNNPLANAVAERITPQMLAGTRRRNAITAGRGGTWKQYAGKHWLQKKTTPHQWTPQH